MATSRRHQLRTLLDEALALPSEQREPFLLARCAHDPELFDEVRSLLQQYEASGEMPEGPPTDRTATRLAELQHQDPLVGQETDGYRIQEVLGRGGMGVVYKALNLTLNRTEALKVITPSRVQNEDLLRRFRVEAQALARIHHTNIVTIYTLRQSDIGAYITMEYVEGRTLAEIITQDGAMDWEQSLRLFRQMLAAFDYAHRRGIIHRDVKPRNIMLMDDGTVKVMDFGLARFYQEQDATMTAGVIGTPSYMSPEQIKGLPLDQRTDLFSLGLTMYEMLTGDLPFDRNTSQFSIQRAIIEERFPSPAKINDEVPGQLSRMVEKALEKDPDRRYQEAGEMLADLQALESELPTVPAGEAQAWSASPKPWKHRMKQGALAAGAAIVLFGLGWAALQGPSLVSVEPPPEDELVADDRIPEEQEEEVVPEQAPEDNPPEEEVEQEQSIELDSDPVTTPPAADGPSRPETDVSAAEEQAQPAQNEGVMDEEVTEEETEPEEAPEESEDAPESSDDPKPVPEETAPVLSAEEQAVHEARDLRGPLVDAIMEDTWEAIPAPVASFYQEQLAPLARRFDITSVGIEVEDFRVQSGSGRTQIPVTVRIDYRQRGRDGIQSVPIPAVWIWLEQDGQVSLSEVGTR